jgi:hypothetical protein
LDAVGVRFFATVDTTRVQLHLFGIHLVRVQQIALANQFHHLVQSDPQWLVDSRQIFQHLFAFVVVVDFDELAVEERFAFADFHNSYGLVMVINHAQRRWLQLVSRVSFGRAGHTISPAEDACQQRANHPHV